jgi:hypothetical protein
MEKITYLGTSQSLQGGQKEEDEMMGHITCMGERRNKM